MCFLPVEAIVGADVYVIVETYGYIQSLVAARRPKITTLSVSNMGRPIVIIFKALGSEYGGILNLNIESDADIAGIHFISDTVPRVNGLPANILVTARYTTDRSQGTQNQCVFPLVEEPSLAGFGAENLRSSEYAFRALSAWLGRGGFEADLYAYAGLNVASYQLSKGGRADGILLLGPITMTEETCGIADRPRLLWAGQGATLNVDGHCSIYTVDIHRKNWYINE